MPRECVPARLTCRTCLGSNKTQAALATAAIGRVIKNSSNISVLAAADYYQLLSRFSTLPTLHDLLVAGAASGLATQLRMLRVR